MFLHPLPNQNRRNSQRHSILLIFTRVPLARMPPSNAESAIDLDEKLRQAYFWIVNNAIISPHYDIEFHTKPLCNIELATAKA